MKFFIFSMSRLTNLVLLIMKSLPKINPGYLNYINENESFYTIAPIEVKRQIWCLNSGTISIISISISIISD